MDAWVNRPGYAAGHNHWMDTPPAAWAPQAIRWRLHGAPLPPLETALVLARAARDMVMSGLQHHGLERLPHGFHHAQAGQDSAWWLVDDEDGDGLIDHVLCMRPAGLHEVMLPLLAAGGEVWLPRLSALAIGQQAGARWQLSTCWMGQIGAGGIFGPARRWTSQTPYLPPRRRLREGGRARGRSGQVRPGREPEAQLLKDIAEAGLPVPLGIGISPAVMRGGRVIEAADVLIPPAPPHRLDVMVPPPGCVPGFATVVFPEPVMGPIALGFGAHAGLGLFEPWPDEEGFSS
jgi:CRISPR-associated protein Csb2